MKIIGKKNLFKILTLLHFLISTCYTRVWVRQLRQLHGMLTELKAGRTREPEEEAQNFDGYSHDVVENKGSVSEAEGNSHDVAENK